MEHRYNILLSGLRRNSLPPAERYADNLLLVADHSRYSLPSTDTSLSLYALFPGSADLVYSLPLSENTVPSVPWSGSMTYDSQDYALTILSMWDIGDYVSVRR